MSNNTPIFPPLTTEADASCVVDDNNALNGFKSLLSGCFNKDRFVEHPKARLCFEVVRDELLVSEETSICTTTLDTTSEEQIARGNILSKTKNRFNKLQIIMP